MAEFEEILPAIGDPELRLDDRYVIERFEDSAVSEQDVVDLWTGEGAVPREEAERRVGEVAFVASLREEGELAGLCTTYLGHSRRLRMDLWHYRTFVAASHRQLDIGRHLLYETLRYLDRRFASGQDRRAAGLILELENPLLKRVRNEAEWPHTALYFIGENQKGDHVRVHYFPGALAPPP